MRDVQRIITELVDEYPGSGFIIIKTDVVEGENETNVDWISNLTSYDTERILRSAQTLAHSKEN